MSDWKKRGMKTTKNKPDGQEGKLRLLGLAALIFFNDEGKTRF